MDIIFKIGIFMIPFENFFFAPSAGWATLSPLIFAIYILLNAKKAIKSMIRYKEIFIFILFILLMSLINYIFTGVNLSNSINAFISLGLGCVTLISFDIYFVENGNETKKVVKLLLIAYSIALIVGWMQYLSIKFNIVSLKNIFIFLEKRNYVSFGRVPFTFTEPSFIGMHMFGVLLPFYIVTKNKKIIILMFLICGSALFFEASIRLIVDILIVISIYGIAYVIKNIKKIRVIFITVLLLILMGITIRQAYQTMPRVKQILDMGLYADGSLASRIIRIDASINGFKEDMIHFAFGYGMGNAAIPIREGYDEAMSEYREIKGNNIPQEIEELPYIETDSISYCLYTRMISEFGIIMTMIALCYLFYLAKKGKNLVFMVYLFVLLYLYIQFDSYAFYTIWLYIVMLKKYIINNSGEQKWKEEKKELYLLKS